MNTQKPEPRTPLTQYGNELDVHSLFYTIQGEGPYAGRPAVFLRLGGCNLQCPWCDTEYTKGRATLPVKELIIRIHSLSTFKQPVRGEEFVRLVVITGGEPFRQDLKKLCFALLDLGHIVQIETNGTLPPTRLPNPVTIVCSPKAGRVSGLLTPLITDYKYVLDHNNISDKDGLPTSALGSSSAPARPHEGFRGKIYVSPLDTKDPEENKKNLVACAAVAMQYGYTLGVQLHKLADLP